MKPDRIDIPTIPKVFISYNHKDREVAHKIKDRLELAGIEVTIDSVALTTGGNITEFIKRCIQESGITLSLVSKDSLMSGWVAMETIWSTYSETLRGSSFFPCNIDNEFFTDDFTDNVFDAIDERLEKIEQTLKIRLEKKRGFGDQIDERDRLYKLKVELPSIISRLKNSLCVSLIEGHFDSGIEKVIKDILNKKPVATETFSVDIHKKTKPTTKSPKPLKETKKISGQKGPQTQTPKLVEPPSPETLRRLQDPKASINATPIPTQITLAGIEMVFVKGGEFMMGDDNSGEQDDKPAHKVFVSDFYIGKYPVTLEQWVDLMATNPSSLSFNANCPVESVSWSNVQEFLQKLNIKTGKSFRLPTEAEREYAAGGGASPERTKWAGTSIESELGDYAWYYLNGDGKTHPVGTKKPNKLGIYDLSGNVWEWCNDWFSDTYYEECKRNELINNPAGPKSSAIHVMRGGSWNRKAGDCRVASRSYDTPGGYGRNVGFRILLAL
jgi:formylglycine-generating enzyme required for sulfatase activity